MSVEEIDEQEQERRRIEREKMIDLIERKSALRHSISNVLKRMSQGELEEQSQAVTNLLFESPFWIGAKRVGCYLNMPSGELKTESIVKEILTSDRTLFTPYLSFSTPSSDPSASHSPSATCDSHSPSAPCDSRLTPTYSDMKMLRVYSEEDLGSCKRDKWGIIDPGQTRRDRPANEARQDAMDPEVPPLDLILIPGVAFDSECNRLGRGKAYYDRFLRAYTSTRQSPLLIALALTPQMLPEGEQVPTSELDFQLDGVISPQGTVWRPK